MPGEFCVLCGRSDRPIVEGVCADCFATHTPLVRAPERPTIILCPTCGARKIGAHWEGAGRPALPGAADLLPLLLPHPEASIRTVEWTDASVHPLLREVDGIVHLRFRGTERTEPVRLTVKVEHHTCPECSRRAGHYYAATIQLRGDEDAPREKAQARRERLLAQWESVLPEIRAPWKNAVSWREELPEGIDLYLTDVLSARSITRVLKRALGARLIESATLWGRKNGQDVYRVTFCARIPVARPDAAPARLGRPARRRDGPHERVER